MLLFDDPHHPWRHESQNGNILYFKGDVQTARNALKLTQETSIQGMTEQLSHHFQSVIHYTAGAIETERLTIAWSDHIRSWPIFYTLQSNNIIIANSARQLQEKTGLNAIGKAALTEFAMSGFVSGKHTLVQGLFCLQPGEFLVFDKATSTLITERYFRYAPEYVSAEPQESKIQKLGHILDEITLEIIENAEGRTIWLPLSAGLDSRILLCKLHEHGYQNIQTFTYGPKHNFEAYYAQKTARILGLPWRMIALPNAQIKRYFNSPKRQEFWQYADNLKAIPCMGGLAAMFHLHEQNIAQHGDIFLNGQSGDYITGDHIFSHWFDQKTIASRHFIDAIIEKHYSLWSSLKTDHNIAVIHDSIETIIDQEWRGKSGLIDRASQLENWEYDTRQICYVINGQRIYEFFGFNWELPLWDKRLVQFFKNLPLEDKKNQSLYRKYLRDYNYKELFPEKEPALWRWPLTMLWVIPLANMLSVFPDMKKDFYALMRYFGHYSDQFSVFPLAEHLCTYKDSRNVTSLSVRHWLVENKIDITSNQIAADWI